MSRGAAAFDSEPPFLAVGVLLVAVGLGVWVRSCAAELVWRLGTGAALLAIGGMIVTGGVTSDPAHTDEGLVRYTRLLGLAMAAAVMAGVLLLLRLGNEPACGKIAIRQACDFDRSWCARNPGTGSVGRTKGRWRQNGRLSDAVRERPPPGDRRALR